MIASLIYAPIPFKISRYTGFYLLVSPVLLVQYLFKYNKRKNFKVKLSIVLKGGVPEIPLDLGRSRSEHATLQGRSRYPCDAFIWNAC